MTIDSRSKDRATGLAFEIMGGPYNMDVVHVEFKNPIFGRLIFNGHEYAVNMKTYKAVYQGPTNEFPPDQTHIELGGKYDSYSEEALK